MAVTVPLCTLNAFLDAFIVSVLEYYIMSSEKKQQRFEKRRRKIYDQILLKAHIELNPNLCYNKHCE